jgi:hypothetical protein
MTLLVIYEHLNILTMFCYNLHLAQPGEYWPPLVAWFLSRFLPRFWPFSGVFSSQRASTSALLAVWGFGVLGWVFVQHFEISAKKGFINTFDLIYYCTPTASTNYSS